MGEPGTINNLADLGAAIQERDHVTYEQEFARVLEGKLSEVVPGRFNVSKHLKERGVDHILVTPFKLHLPEGDEQAVAVSVIFNDAQKVFSFQIRADGSLNGEARDYQHDLDREQVALDVIDIVDRIGLGLWTPIDANILAEKDPGDPEEEPSEEEATSSRSGKNVVDPERLAFLNGQENMLFGAVNKDLGFEGYHVGVFSRGLVFEHPKKSNAAFVLRTDSELVDPDDPEIFARPAERRLSLEARQAIIQDRVLPLIKRAPSKKSLMDLGAVRIVHQANTETWKEKMQRVIDEKIVR